MSESSYVDSPASKDSAQIILKGSAAVVSGLLVLGQAIPIIGKFAKVLQKALEVIKQASRNEDAIVRLHDHMVDISVGLLPHLEAIKDHWQSRITGFDNALNELMDLLEKISSYIIGNQKSLFTKVMSATDTNLVTQVNNYIQKLTDRKDNLMDLIAIDTNRKITDIAVVSKDHDYSNDSSHRVPSIQEHNSRAPVNRDEEESSTDEKVFPARDTYLKNLSNNK